MSAVSTTAPVERRDIRADAQPFKRDKDHNEKWSQGMRPLAGVTSLLPKQGEKYRPRKQWSQVYVLSHSCLSLIYRNQKLINQPCRNSDRKSRANVTPKPFGALPRQTCSNSVGGRIFRQTDAYLEAAEVSSHPLSKSLLDLLPLSDHYNGMGPHGDEGVLYSFDRTDSPPNRVDLGGLVELAEKKWVNEQTEKIIKGEYEVLDAQGEVVPAGRGKGRKSPRQRASKVQATPAAKVLDDDDDFELI
ncbi:hypothetical protein CJF31_00010115 [Rutstroemia sp. NJR-2017a BVV2]|nr:hypothetical protein CJF31_00009876 [Rutstroemia sp. NJR-2017a BVV2]PQE19694.1 hypothetical protein CJF31_00010115 [Rutstroemia sp. NJR-2017a BVV2]